MKKVTLFSTILSLFLTLNNLAQESISDQYSAQPLSPTVVKFNPLNAGASNPMLWGADAGGWTNPVIWEKSKRYMGAENIKITRIPAMADGQLDGETQLRQNQKDWIKARIDDVAVSGELLQVMLNPGGGDAGDAWYRADYSRYALLMKLAKDYIESFGHTVVSITGHNEPDPGYAPATMQMNNNLFSACINSGYFDVGPGETPMRYCGGNTLNPDFAFDWYNYSIAYVNEGNTHQLAGTFDGYANFYTTVTNNGHYRTNDEVHNIMEAIVGHEYGMDAAIYWPDFYHGCNLARGEFTKATSNGARLGYGEHRFNWTAAAVYKTGAKIQGFAGGSERQATTTNFSYLSKDIPIFCDGYGPYKQFVLTLPGGNGYGVNQPNSERVINITYGEDPQPAISGNYILVNRESGQVLTSTNIYNGGNVNQSAFSSSSTNQQWQVLPLAYNSYGADANYFQLKPFSNTNFALDVNNGSWNDNANIIVWTNGNAANQQWYLEYADNGYFYIRSKESTYCLTATAGNDVRQFAKSGATDQQWRFVPVVDGLSLDLEAPESITNLGATTKTMAIQLDWSASSAIDLAGYSILRAPASGGPYYTIARNVTSTSFLDNTVKPGTPYYYAIIAEDNSLNKSSYSNEVSATVLGGDMLVAHYDFEGNATDDTENMFNASVYNNGAYGTGHLETQCITLNGSNQFVQLPFDVSNHEEITVATWVKWDGTSVGDWQRIFDFGNGENEYMMLTANRPGGGMRFAITIGSWQNEQAFNAPSLPTGVWKHVAVTLGATSAKLYVDGNLVGQTNVTLNPTDFTPLKNYIGGSQWIGDAHFDGSFDDFRIYNYELSAQQVSDLFAGTLSVDDVVIQDYMDIWPLPAKDVINVRLNPTLDANKSDLTVFDSNGRTLVKTNLTGSETKLNVLNLASGIYILKLSSESKSFIKKFVVKQ
ncbi:LamG-like jellyroll fold domain-containing protein [Tamlana flava]|uniref:LamG-like jellyroll fold domain-containing protein n=1 Tax=Tamlana flava TaxID=3158572 RepID=UPI00351BACD6